MQKKKYIYLHTCVYLCTHARLRGGTSRKPRGHGLRVVGPPPLGAGRERRELPPSPRASPRAGRGQGPASADVTQLPGFSKERRTAGWQSLRSHICSFRILRAYSTRRLTPAAPLLLHGPAAQAWQGLGPRGSWEPAPCPLPPAGRGTHTA